MDPTVLKTLKPVVEHRFIALSQYVSAHLDLKVWRNSNDVGVECCMVQLTESEAVGNDRLPQRMTIGENVRGFQ